MISSCSSSTFIRSRVGRNGKPKASCSALCQPAPMPGSIRPPEIWSAVAIIFARIEGWRNEAGETMVPSRRVEVIAASPLIVAHASRDCRPSFGNTER